MAKHTRWAWWLALTVGAAAMVANCSQEEEVPPPSGGPKKTIKSACKSPRKLTISGLEPTTMPGVLKGTAKGSDSKEWTIHIELSDRPDFKHKPGTYDLASQESYDGCRQCVIGFQGADDLLDAPKHIFQTGGVMRLETVTSPPSGVTRGTLENLELREVELDKATGEVTEVSGGTCYQVTRFDWDTTPAPNTKCTSAEDCGDPSTTTCDLKTGTCVAFQCEPESNKGCASNEICLIQNIEAIYGACYRLCTPFLPEDACPSGFECVQLDHDQTEGRCLPPGGAAEGASCKAGVIQTGCQPGLRCVGPEGAETCRRACDFFDDTSPCGAGQKCVYGGFCTDEQGDSAAIGAACGGDSFDGSPCGSDETTYRGICTDVNGTLRCQQACRPGGIFQDCGEQLVCAVGDTESALPTCQPKVEDEEEVQP
jgi:hypothetical protein